MYSKVFYAFNNILYSNTVYSMHTKLSGKTFLQAVYAFSLTRVCLLGHGSVYMVM